MKIKNKKECFSVGIIGGAHGPTAVFMSDSEGQASADKQWHRVLDACKRQAVLKDRNFTGDEVRTHLIETYGAEEIEPLPRQKQILKVNVLASFYPEVLQQPVMPDMSADKKMWEEWVHAEHMDYLDAAEKIPDETYGLRYAFLRIPHTETTEAYYLACKDEQKKRENKNLGFFARHLRAQPTNYIEEELEMLLEIELSTGYMMLQNGCDMLMNEVILWQGISKEDIEKCTPRFMAFAAAIRDTGNLKGL